MTIIIDGCDIIIDEDDYLKISQFKWYLHKPQFKKQGLYYFRHDFCLNGKRGAILLHRYIMGCSPNDGKVVDHINGNGLDNRKSNLRICTKAENNKNAKKSKNNTSGFKGVNWNKQRKKWMAVISVNNKNKYLGYFDNPSEAYAEYIKASKIYHGEFARQVW